jgi:AhpD family alkylhydroperoxidase
MAVDNYLEYGKEIQTAMGKLHKEMPQIMGGIMQMHKNVTSDGVLTAKTKALIATAVSVRVDCEGCITRHIGEALQFGASREEIMEAVSVSILLGGGPGVVSAAKAMKAMEQMMEAQKG